MSTERSMNLLADACLIVCILPKGKASELEQGLTNEFGIHDANFHHARGVGRLSIRSANGIGAQREKEIFEVTIPREKADEVFDFLYNTSGMDEPHGGLIYMTAAPKTSVLELPVLE